MSFASKLHDLRIAQRLSLQNVADAVGISKAHVFNLEKGITANPSMELVKSLADLFKVRVADLVGENPEAEGEPAEMVSMFRDLKKLDESDREMIRMLMETMKNKRKADEG
jgi:transcriptional regulator with XRE-family HTH domain